MCTAVVLVLAGLALGAAPPGKLTPEQVKLLRQRPFLGVNEQTLEIELRVYGPWDRQIERTAARLGDYLQFRGQWAKAAVCLRAVLEVRKKLDGEGHWRTVDARLGVEDVLAQAKR